MKLTAAILTLFFVLLLGATLSARAKAGGYYYRPTCYTQSYGTPTYYQPYFNYYPTLPTYSCYSSYSYPSYYSNYYDGGYHYHEAGYWHGYYYPAGYYRWYNGYWQAQQDYVPSAHVPSAHGDWKSQLLQIASNRDQIEGEIRKNYADSLLFNQAVGALGMQGNFRFDHYGQFPGMPFSYVNHNANLGTYGANGSTMYGYSLNSIKDIYGSSDVNVLFQQAQRLAQQAQQLGGQATQEFQASITQEGNNRNRVAEILARSQAAAEALRAAEGSPGTTRSTTTIRSGQEQGQQQGPPEPGGSTSGGQGGPLISPEFAQLATTKCLKCHGPEKQEAKLDIRTYPQMSLGDKEKVWSRIMTTDKDKLMPKGGPPLSAAEKRVFFTN